MRGASGHSALCTLHSARPRDRRARRCAGAFSCVVCSRAMSWNAKSLSSARLRCCCASGEVAGGVGGQWAVCSVAARGARDSALALARARASPPAPILFRTQRSGHTSRARRARCARRARRASCPRQPAWPSFPAAQLRPWLRGQHAPHERPTAAAAGRRRPRYIRPRSRGAPHTCGAHAEARLWRSRPPPRHRLQAWRAAGHGRGAWRTRRRRGVGLLARSLTRVRNL